MVGTVPPAAEKYRKQTKDFYNSFNSDIDAVLKVASEEQLSKAQSVAALSLKTRPPVLFKNANSKPLLVDPRV